jgi:hypothetical protein
MVPNDAFPYGKYYIVDEMLAEMAKQWSDLQQ